MCVVCLVPEINWRKMAYLALVVTPLTLLAVGLAILGAITTAPDWLLVWQVTPVEPIRYLLIGSLMMGCVLWPGVRLWLMPNGSRRPLWLAWCLIILLALPFTPKGSVLAQLVLGVNEVVILMFFGHWIVTVGKPKPA